MSDVQSQELTPFEPNTAELMLSDARKAAEALGKNSKLRAHYIKLTVMNNVLRAFVYLYKLEQKYTNAQEALLRMLCNVESRKNRIFLTSDKIILHDALVAYEEILHSCTDDQLKEVLQLVDARRSEGKWLVVK